MEGLTILEMADMLGITKDAAKKRLKKHGIKPKEFKGFTAMYDPSVVETIKNIAKAGRSKKITTPLSSS